MNSIDISYVITKKTWEILRDHGRSTFIAEELILSCFQIPNPLLQPPNNTSFEGYLSKLFEHLKLNFLSWQLLNVNTYINSQTNIT